MIVDAVRFVADRLADPTTGVNALLSSVPRPGSDAAPPAVLVYNEMDAAVTALGPIDATLLQDGPALLVAYLHRTADAVHVLVRYAAPEADAATLARDGWHTLRAAMRAAWTRPADATSATHQVRRNGVTLGPVADVVPYAPPPQSAPDAFAPALVVLLPASDDWATSPA